ncbi:MAG: peptidoglycan-binding protein [Lachnospiraceae bacterium]|nr:peptidoglycan-binding protein [Lachnospiraceae bacterium]
MGIYWFIYASNMTSLINNAKKCVEVIEPYRQYITLGVWADWEYDSDKRAGALSVSTRSNLVDTFNCWIEEAGYEAGIYSNQDYIQSGKFQPWLVAKYPLWFAKYNTDISSYAYKGKNGRPYMWQHSSSGDGKACGVSSKNLDLNRVYVDIISDAVVPPVDIVTQNPNVITASDNPYLEPTRTIYYAAGKTLMHGDDVKWVQWHLWRFGLLLDKDGIPDAGQIDGKWGSASDKALNIAQGRLKLQQDGKCGPLTRQAFEQV